MGLFGKQPSQWDYAGRAERMAGLTADLPAGAKKKGGFFSKGGTGRAIAGSIGDFLLQMNDAQPIYGPAAEAYQKRIAEAEEYQRRRQHGLEDYEKKQEIDARYKTKEPSEFDQMLTAAGITDPAARQQAYVDLVQNRREGSPYQFDITNDGLPDIVPRSEYRRIMGGQPSGQPGAYKEGQTAVNPQTNERIVYQGGRWVPASGENRGGNASGGFSGSAY